MIYIDSSTQNLDLYIEKHQQPENAVKIDIAYCMQPGDPSSVITSTDVSVRENYYVYTLDASSLVSGQYEYSIIDTSNLTIYESGLLYKMSDTSANQNLTQNIVYER